MEKVASQNLLYSAYVLTNAQDSNFDHIKNSSKKNVAYNVALNIASKHFQKRKEQGLNLYSGHPFTDEANGEELYEKLVFASYFLWPDDIEFENEYLAFVTQKYKEYQEKNKTNNYLELPVAEFREKGWEAEDNYFTQYGSDEYLPFVRYDFLAREKLAYILKQEDKTLAYDVAKNIVKNENLFRYFLGQNYLNSQDIDLATTYLLFPSDQDFSSHLPKSDNNEIKFGFSSDFTNLHLPYVAVSWRIDAINNNQNLNVKPTFKELLVTCYPHIKNVQVAVSSKTKDDAGIKGIEEFLFDEEEDEKTKFEQMLDNLSLPEEFMINDSNKTTER